MCVICVIREESAKTRMALKPCDRLADRQGGNFLSSLAISCPRLQVDASKEHSFEGSLIRMDLHRRRKPVSGQGFISFAQNGLNQLPGAGHQPGLPGTDASEAPIGECLVTLSYRLCATGGTFVPANRREPRG